MADFKDRVIVDVSLRTKDSEKRAAELTAVISKQKAEIRGLTKELKDLQQGEATLLSTRQKTQQQIQQLIKAGKQNTAEFRALQATLRDVDKAYTEVRSEITATSTQINRLKNDNKEAGRELRVLNREIIGGTESLEGQRAKLQRLTRQYDTFQVGINGTQRDLEKLGREVDELSNSIGEQELATNRGQRFVGQYGRAIREAFLPNIPILDNFASSLSSPLGIAGAGIGAVVALGSAWRDASLEVEKNRLEVEQLTGVTGEYANVVAGTAEAIQQTFGIETAESLRAVNTLTRELGGSLDENLNLMSEAAALTGDNFNEALDVIKEYPAQFAGLGVSAKQFLSIATSPIQDGIYSDKGVDAIKEALISVRELTPATRAALDGIGLSGDAIQQRIAQGSSTLFDEVQNISARLSELPPQSQEVGTAIADIFRGAGEDAGIRYLSTIKDINLEFDGLLDGASEQIQRQAELAKINAELNTTWNSLFDSSGEFFSQAEVGLKSVLLQGLQGAIRGLETLINGFVGLFNNSVVVRAGFNLLFANLKTGLDIALSAFDQLLNAGSTIGKVISAVLTGDFEDIGGIIKEGFAEGASITGQLGRDIADNYIDGFESTINGRLEEVSLVPNAAAKGEQEGLTFGQGFQKGIDKSNISAAEAATVESADKKAKALKEAQEAENEALQEAINTLKAKLTEEELAIVESYNQRLIDKETFNRQLFELEERRIEEEIALLEEGTTERTEKELELARFRQEAFDQLEEERLEKEAERLEREQELKEIANQVDAELAEAKFDRDIALLGSAQRLADGIIKAKGEESAAGKAAAVVQKAAAAIEIGINLSRELSAINTAIQLQRLAASTAAAAAGPVGALALPGILAGITAKGIAQRVVAIAQAGGALAGVLGFSEGGATGSDGVMTSLQAGPSGLTHSGIPVTSDPGLMQRGGKVSKPTLAIVGENNQSEYIAPSYVLNNPEAFPHIRALEALRTRRSSGNYLSGIPMLGFNSGGFTSFSDAGLTSRSASSIQAEQVAAAVRVSLEDMPAPVVYVEDINTGQEGLNEVQVLGNIN